MGIYCPQYIKGSTTPSIGECSSVQMPEMQAHFISIVQSRRTGTLSLPQKVQHIFLWVQSTYVLLFLSLTMMTIEPLYSCWWFFHWQIPQSWSTSWERVTIWSWKCARKGKEASRISVKIYSIIMSANSYTETGQLASVHLKLWLTMCRYWNDAYFEALASIKKVADTHKLTLAEISLRWVSNHSLMKREHGDSILIGASSLNHIEQVCWIICVPILLLFLHTSPRICLILRKGRSVGDLTHHVIYCCSPSLVDIADNVVKALDDAWFKVKPYATKYFHCDSALVNQPQFQQTLQPLKRVGEAWCISSSANDIRTRLFSSDHFPTVTG